MPSPYSLPVLLVIVVLAGLSLRLLLALPGLLWRYRQRRRQRPLARYPRQDLEAALQFDSELRDLVLARGTISRVEIDRGIARSLALVRAERMERR